MLLTYVIYMYISVLYIENSFVVLLYSLNIMKLKDLFTLHFKNQKLQLPLTDSCPQTNLLGLWRMSLTGSMLLTGVMIMGRWQCRNQTTS